MRTSGSARLNGCEVVPRLGAEIGTRGDQALGSGIVHEGPRRVARLENSSISGTIGSVSVVIVNA